MALDRIRHRLFVGTRVPPEMTVYDSLSGKEIQNLPRPETIDGVHYDDNVTLQPWVKQVHTSREN
jgi:hypothetical protein